MKGSAFTITTFRPSDGIDNIQDPLDNRFNCRLDLLRRDGVHNPLQVIHQIQQGALLLGAEPDSLILNIVQLLCKLMNIDIITNKASEKCLNFFPHLIVLANESSR
jgi:hypothetical protein